MDTLEEFEKFHESLRHERVRELFDDDIVSKIKECIKNNDYDNGHVFFYRCLRDGDPKVEEFGNKLNSVKNVFNNPKRYNSYIKKIKNQVQTNQFLGSLFELNIQSTMICRSKGIDKCNIILNPEYSDGATLDAKIQHDREDILIECKSIGYTHKVNSRSISSMKWQVWNALAGKLLSDKQISVVDHENKTILCLALCQHGADYKIGQEAVDEFLNKKWPIHEYKNERKKDKSNVSAIYLYGSSYVRRDCKRFINTKSTIKLSVAELEILDILLLPSQRKRTGQCVTIRLIKQKLSKILYNLKADRSMCFSLPN